MPTLSALETVPAFAVITIAIGLMGGLQGLVQHGFYGKPKATSVDPWDRKIEERDDRIRKHPEEFGYKVRRVLRDVDILPLPPFVPWHSGQHTCACTLPFSGLSIVRLI